MVVTVDKTLGHAWLEGLRPHFRCQRGKRIGVAKVEPCGYAAEISLETLIWTRGAKFPLWRLPSRIKCPRCGGTSVEVAWMPGGSPAARAGRDLYQCKVACDGARAR